MDLTKLEFLTEDEIYEKDIKSMIVISEENYPSKLIIKFNNDTEKCITTDLELDEFLKNMWD